MRKSIIFVTGNSRKVDEAVLACEPLGIIITQKHLNIDEIQSQDASKVSEHKAMAAYRLVNKPVVVTDSFWHITALNGFPGAYAKDVDYWFTEKNFLDLVRDYEDKSICFSENITYFDGVILKQFSKTFWGTIVEPRGTGQALENVVEIDGVTLGEHRKNGTVSHTAEDYVWIDFATWFKDL